MSLPLDAIYNMEAEPFFQALGSDALDLLVTSPPYANAKKGVTNMSSREEYLNISPDDYVAWFSPIAKGIYDALKPTGSFVLNIDSHVESGQISLYIYDLLIHLTRDLKFKFVNDLYWIKSVCMPSGRATTYKGPRRAVEQLWHFTKNDNYKVDTRNILMRYSKGMSDQLNDYARRQKADDLVLPSGHSYKAERIFTRHEGSTPMNYIYCAPCASNDEVTNRWKELGIPVHPARFPTEIPDYFIRMLTDPGDTVGDCFNGSGTSLGVAKQLGRHFVGCDRSKIFCEAAQVRLDLITAAASKKPTRTTDLTEFSEAPSQ